MNPIDRRFHRDLAAARDPELGEILRAVHRGLIEEQTAEVGSVLLHFFLAITITVAYFN